MERGLPWFREDLSFGNIVQNLFRPLLSLRPDYRNTVGNWHFEFTLESFRFFLVFRQSKSLGLPGVWLHNFCTSWLGRSFLRFNGVSVSVYLGERKGETVRGFSLPGPTPVSQHRLRCTEPPKEVWESVSWFTNTSEREEKKNETTYWRLRRRTDRTVEVKFILRGKDRWKGKGTKNRSDH